jgi:hypothetical protein
MVTDMTDQTPADNGKTTLLQTGYHERVIFVAPCFEKKKAFRGISYSMILFTLEQMIIISVPSSRVRSGMTDIDKEMRPEIGRAHV